MRRIRCALLLGAFLTEAAIAASFDALDKDGWYTWEVEAVEGAPAWCCITRNQESRGSRACNLDSRHSSYGDCDDAGAANGLLQMYAKIESGKAVRLRTLSPGCPVESEGGVSDLGEVEVEESFNWLEEQVRSDSRVSEDAVAAIAVHRGGAPLQFLIDAADEAAEADIRASAMFWLARTGAGESEEVIMQAIADDPDREVREDAVFALSQLPEERAVDALIAVLENRGLHRELREKALFWLAQSESDRALAVFERLLADGTTARH